LPASERRGSKQPREKGLEKAKEKVIDPFGMLLLAGVGWVKLGATPALVAAAAALSLCLLAPAL
jgi:hypothetical protein